MSRNRTEFNSGVMRLCPKPLVAWASLSIWLGSGLMSGSVRAEEPLPDPLRPVTLRPVVEKGLKRLEQGSTRYIENRQCFSCHHQTLSILPMAAARERGFAVNAEQMQEQVRFILDSFRPRKEQILKGEGIGGTTTTAAYALFTLEAAGHPADDLTAALVEYLLKTQAADGYWLPKTDRPPSEGSRFTSTAVALRMIRAYGLPKPPKLDAPQPGPESKPGTPESPAGDESLPARIAHAEKLGLTWLLKTAPHTTEDKVFRLRGLVDCAAMPEEVGNAREALLKEQREDGSWAQLADLPGDPYATGTVLAALRMAGIAPDADACRKGVRYLVGTQQPDGAWIVQTRSQPVQKFFDNGDPGEKSQFISFTATGWATLALLEMLPEN